MPTSTDGLLFVASSGATSGNVPGFERLECLWRCVNAIKGWFDGFHEVSPQLYPGLPFFVWAQSIRCITVLKRLSMLQDPAWDCETVRRTVDVLEILDWMAIKMEMASREVGEKSNDDFFMKMSRILRWCRDMRTQVEQYLPADSVGYSIDNTAGIDVNKCVMDQTGIGTMPTEDFSNELWIQQMFGLPQGN